LVHESDRDHLVDKQLYNFEMLGLIATVLPRAKIIHCIRHPLDTCLSCYFQIFAEGNEHTFNLDALGDYYLIYHELMQHWHSVIPTKIFTLEYEALVTAPEEKTRELLEYLELDWEPACLDFHKRESTVVTSSVNQVRESIYTTSRQRWKNYERHLGPLIDKLQPLLPD
ncbi:MAG: sulfotransferase, partial [Thiotrichales bacterium]|nr:sulfotransferase [Thiotrichales bacterium]